MFAVDRELHRERKSIGHSPGTFCGDQRTCLAEVVTREDVVDRTGDLAIPVARNRLRHTEAPLHEIGVVNVEIQDRAAAGIA